MKWDCFFDGRIFFSFSFSKPWSTFSALKRLLLVQLFCLFSFATKRPSRLFTDSTKKTRPEYSICMCSTNFDSRPFNVHVQNIFFEKTPIKVCIPLIYTSLGTFCTQISQFFEAQWVFVVCLKIDKYFSSKKKVVNFGILPIV